MQGCAAGRGLLVISGLEFSGLSCGQEFAGALLAGIRWADLLAVVCWISPMNLAPLREKPCHFPRNLAPLRTKLVKLTFPQPYPRLFQPENRGCHRDDSNQPFSRRRPAPRLSFRSKELMELVVAMWIECMLLGIHLFGLPCPLVLTTYVPMVGGQGANRIEYACLVSTLGMFGSGIQGYLAHKKTPPPRTLQ